MTINRPSRYEFSTSRLRFTVDGDRCVGRLAHPDRPREPPVVVLAPGVGMVRQVGLDDLAERYAARGFAAFTFDYRGWGESDESGDAPRTVSPTRQLADLRGAVDAVRGLDDVDGSRLALWGVDLSGATALELAGEDRHVDAVIARTPAPGRRLGPDRLRPRLRGLGRGVVDRLLSVAGRTRSVPLFAATGEVGVVTAVGAERAVRSLLQPGTVWANETPARSLLALRGHDVDPSAVSCPALFVTGDRDEVVDADAVEAMSEQVADGSFLRLPVDHYDTFADAASRVVGHELAFLDDVL